MSKPEALDPLTAGSREEREEIQREREREYSLPTVDTA